MDVFLTLSYTNNDNNNIYIYTTVLDLSLLYAILRPGAAYCVCILFLKNRGIKFNGDKYTRTALIQPIIFICIHDQSSAGHRLFIGDILTTYSKRESNLPPQQTNGMIFF